MGSLAKKIELLGDASKYDICASMSSPRKTTGSNRIGNPDPAGICHTFTPDGRCMSLFKVLLTNHCIHDCKYCMNNCTKRKTKARFTPEELARAFMGLYVRNYVEGFFLSSGVFPSADKASQDVIDAVDLIRNKYHFQGYMHIKILPGTSKHLIEQIMEKVDRVSLNVEQPSASRLDQVSSMKSYEHDIIKCQKQIQGFVKKHLPAGHTTQYVIGAIGESDKELIESIDWEYENVDIKRAYFSSFVPVKGTPLEKAKPEENIRRRENFLYRTDWLMRQYKYSKEDMFSILNDDDMLPLETDPKVTLALKDDLLPLDVNEASYSELLHVPGIGYQSARRIINLRKVNQKIENHKDLRRLGVVWKRAKSFVVINGKRQSRMTDFLKPITV